MDCGQAALTPRALSPSGDLEAEARTRVEHKTGASRSVVGHPVVSPPVRVC